MMSLVSYLKKPVQSTGRWMPISFTLLAGWSVLTRKNVRWLAWLQYMARVFLLSLLFLTAFMAVKVSIALCPSGVWVAVALLVGVYFGNLEFDIYRAREK